MHSIETLIWAFFLLLSYSRAVKNSIIKPRKLGVEENL